MKLFIRKNLLFWGIPIIFFILWQLPLFYYDIKSDRIAKIYSKERLDSLKNISDKIILIGGSNLLFGIDKYMLEVKLKRPVVSLAHNRTDGISNMLKVASKVYRKGDIALISLEYGGLSKGSSGELMDYYISGNPLELIEYFFKIYLLDKAWALDQHSKNKYYSLEQEKNIKAIYQSFNNELFLQGLTNENYRKLDSYSPTGISLTYSKKDKQIINDFIILDSIQIIGIHPILAKQILNLKNIENISKKIIDHLPIPYITEQSNYIFDTAYIFDYSFHLNKKGRELRTLKIVADLQKFISTNYKRKM
jgi:hypothetical protein